jgi:hypothetical protein
MAIFEIQGADGKCYQIDAPDMQSAIAAISAKETAADAPAVPATADSMARSSATGAANSPPQAQNAGRDLGAKDAFEAGQKFVASKMPTDAARRAIARMSPADTQRFQDGFVSRLLETLRQVPDRRSVVNQIAHSPAARDRLAVALGPQRARELQAMLHVEDILDLARPAAPGGASRARELAELGLAGGADAAGGEVRNPDPTSIMSAALIYGAARGRHVIDPRIARQVAGMLTSHDPRQLAMGIRMLASNKRMLAAIQTTDAALAAILVGGAEPVLPSRTK